DAGNGFLKRRGVYEAYAITEARQTHAEVGVFRDVERVPGAHALQDVGAEMIRRAPQWNGNAQPCQTRKKEIEPRRIFQGEHARQPVVVSVIDVEACLEAGNSL